MMSCNDDEEMVKEDPVEQGNQIQMFYFENLEVGQTFRFSLLSGERYFDNEQKSLFEYTGDTLEIELIAKSENDFTFTERILPTSAMFSNDDINYWMGKDSVYTHNWKIENDTLKVVPSDKTRFKSHLYFGGNFWEGGVFIPLDDFNNQSTTIEGWKTAEDFCQCNRDLYTENFSLFDVEYDRLNVAIRDEPMAGDAKGNTYLYNKTDGIVRSTHYSAWSGRGFGWDRTAD